MKVLFVAGADQHYGTYQMSKYILKSVRELDNSMDYVVITQKNGPLNEWCKTCGIENYVFPYRYCMYYPTTSKLKGSIKHFLKILHVTVLNLMAIYKLGRAGLLKDIDLIHTNNNRDIFGIMLSKIYHIPNITHLREFSRAHFGLKPIYRNQISIMNRYSSKFIAISNVVMEDWIEYGLDERKIEVVYDGVDTKKYSMKTKFRTGNMPLRLIMCGAIYEEKGHKQLLEATSYLIEDGYNILVDFYGAAPNEIYLNNLKHYIEKCNLQDSIRVMGYRDNINEVLNEYDVGVVCSKAEGFGLVTVEYLLSGLTVIASDTGANPEILNNGKYGYIYPFNNTKELAKLIATIYNEKNDAGAMLENKLSQERYAKDKFAIDITAKRLIEIYYSVTTAQSRRGSV